MPKEVNILAVDDVEENLIALSTLLRRPGLRLLEARSGNEALEALLSNDIALALLDVNMPGMDGFELAELMRGSERTRHVPIIFLTAAVPSAAACSRATRPAPSTSCTSPSIPTCSPARSRCSPSCTARSSSWPPRCSRSSRPRR
jgi:CheY-like chemotaxis protein